MRERSLGYCYALLATMVWAGNFVVSRAVAHLIPPWQCNFWRWAVALAVLLPFALRQLRRDWPLLRRHWRYLSLMAILGVTLMNTLIYKAGQSTTSLNMALLVPVAPIVALVCSRLFYGEALTPQRLLGLGLALSGVLALICQGDPARLTGLEFASGDLWALGGAVCFGLYSLLMRQRPQAMGALSFNAVAFGLGLLYSLPFTVAEAWLLPAPHWSAPVLMGILYAGVGCSSLAFWLWTRAIDRVGAVNAGFVYYSLPVFAAAGSAVVLGEGVSTAQMLGGALVIGGIVAATAPCGRTDTNTGAAK